MGACRQSRPSEIAFDQIVLAVRGLDKLLWHGSPHHLEDVKEYAEDIKSLLDEVVSKFQEEMDLKNL